MIIDIILVILLVLAAFKGYRLGLIAGLCSYLAFIVGLAAAMKLSAVVSVRIGQVIKISDKWLPFLAFFVVFIAVVMLVRWLGKIVQRFSEKIMLGGINRIGGVVFYCLIYISIFAIFLFYINQLKLLPQGTVATSATYGYIKPFGRYAIDGLGYIIPIFKNMFQELENFFGRVSEAAT